LNDDKENFATPLETPVRRQRSKKNAPDMMITPVLSPSKSMDSGMNDLSVTPKGSVFATPNRPPLHAHNSNSSNGSAGPVTPKSSKKVFGSIESGLNKMKNMLTPRKRANSSDSGPVVVSGKALCNVSTTASHNPPQVLSDLTKALMCKGIQCQQKGYILRGKIIDPSGTAKLSFELEVCRIPNLNVVGIRRKRLKGDAWCYKKVCEEVLKMTAVSSTRQ
jgi:maternal embryonic leucine zipper kinase